MRTLTLTAALALAFANAQAAGDWYGLVARGAAAEVEAALAAGADPDAPDEHGWPPLAIAAARNPDPGVIHALARAGADLEAETDIGISAYRPIHIAARSNPNPAVLRALVAAGADVNARTSYGATALSLAAEWEAHSLTNLTRYEELEVEAASLEASVLTLPAPLPEGREPSTVTLYLPDIGFELEVRVLAVDETRTRLTLQREPPSPPDLEQVRVNVPIVRAEDPPPPTNATPYDVLEALIDLGADVNSRDDYGSSPLMSAVRQPDGYRLAQLLLHHGASVRARTESGFTALHAAAASKEADVRTIELLLAQGLDVNVGDRQGGTPIMNAVLFGSPHVIEALLDAGGNPRFPERYTSLYGANMMDLARQNESLYRDGEIIHPVYWRLNDLQHD